MQKRKSVFTYVLAGFVLALISYGVSTMDSCTVSCSNSAASLFVIAVISLASLIPFLIFPQAFVWWKRIMGVLIPLTVIWFLSTSPYGALGNDLQLSGIFVGMVFIVISVLIIISHAIYSKIQQKKGKATFGA